MNKLIFAATFSLSILAINVDAQTKKINISGKIISLEESFPLEGVSIVVKGTDNATGTQADGTFNLSIDPEDKILVVKLSGYESQEVKITRLRDYSVVLKKADLTSGRREFFNALPALSINDINLN